MGKKKGPTHKSASAASTTLESFQPLDLPTLAASLKQTPAAPHWDRAGVVVRHGVCAPLFCLHSSQSCGIGEYADLTLLIDWCVKVGFSAFQLLPINDATDSPYSSFSAFALNPAHLALAHKGWLPYSGLVGENSDLVRLQKELLDITRRNQRDAALLATKAYDKKHSAGDSRYKPLSAGSGLAIRVNYDDVRRHKYAFLEQFFELVRGFLVADKAFQAFCENNDHWLHGYAAYKALKERYPQEWERWPTQYRDARACLPEVAREERDRVLFHKFVQFLCFEQLARVRKYADERGVLMKGDVPILVGRDSADVWLSPHYFKMDFEAGAPPDMYAKDGQGWGFPPYNWDAMAKDEYWWWKERLRYASQFYHLYRIDHIVGFYRLWHIPRGKSPKQGYFEPQAEEEWVPLGERLLKMFLAAAPTMLPIGEDLGSVPDEVRVSLRRLGISATKVVRWERQWQQHGQPYTPFHAYQQTSMCTVSSHDSETLRQWWTHHPDESVVFARFLGLASAHDSKPPAWTPDIQRRILKDAHGAASLFRINLIQEYLAAAQDGDPSLVWDRFDDERINVPGTVSDFNWTNQTRASLEQMLQSAPLLKVVSELLPAGTPVPLPPPLTPVPQPPTMTRLELPPIALHAVMTTAAAAAAPVLPIDEPKRRGHIAVAVAAAVPLPADAEDVPAIDLHPRAASKRKGRAVDGGDADRRDAKRVEAARLAASLVRGGGEVTADGVSTATSRKRRAAKLAAAALEPPVSAEKNVRRSQRLQLRADTIAARPEVIPASETDESGGALLAARTTKRVQRDRPDRTGDIATGATSAAPAVLGGSGESRGGGKSVTQAVRAAKEDDEAVAGSATATPTLPTVDVASMPPGVMDREVDLGVPKPAARRSAREPTSLSPITDDSDRAGRRGREPLVPIAGAAEHAAGGVSAALQAPVAVVTKRGRVMERGATGGLAPPTGEAAREIGVVEAVSGGGFRGHAVQEALDNAGHERKPQPAAAAAATGATEKRSQRIRGAR